MKKEGNELIVQPKAESYDEVKCFTCNEIFNTDRELEKHKLSHSTNGRKKYTESMNGIIELDESSDSEEEIPSQENNSADEKLPIETTFKKEETMEEKIIADDTILNSSDTELPSTDANDQFPSDFQDKLTENVDENPLIEFDKNITEQNDDEALEKSGHSENEDDTNTVNDINTTSTNQEVEGSVSDHNENEETEETGEESLTSKLSSTEENDSKSTNIDDDERESVTPKDNEESEKNEKDKEGDTDSTENKRPSSRESTTSTTSSSSERITIRSASQLNQLVSSTDVKIKTEKETSEKFEKAGISVLNPSQLGASDNSSAGNLLQSNSFVQSGDPMLGFISSGMQDVQCDVCETHFTNNILLDEHKALHGHYKCQFTPECATFIFQTMTELSSHQQNAHGVINQSPVQQLAHQVQSLPMRYQMDQPVSNNYQPIPPFPQANQQNRGMVPQMLVPPQNNVSLRQYNVPGAPRIGGVRSVMPPQGNVLKRGSAAPSFRHSTPVKRRCVDNFPNRNGDIDCKVVSVQKPDNTDDVVAQLSKSITITARQETQKKNDTVAVTNMLANRGITVSSVPTKTNKSSNPVAMLNLNSAVSLIPTNSSSNIQNRQNSGFAVPQSRIGSNRQSMLAQTSQTVDLTGPEQPRSRGTSRSSKFTCRICDRAFLNQDQLNQHMMIHRSGPRKQLPYKCTNCSAQYPTQQALLQHRQTCRRDAVSGTNEMVIPIVDVKQPGILQRLQSFGINHVIPLNALGSQASNGTFGIPILAFSSDRALNSNLANIGISNILPVGPLKRL